jgi:peptide/nickel transport system ATP-binding protein
MIPAEEAPILAANELEIEYAIRGERVRALDSATLVVRRGEITALVGESGSGKTTLGMAAGRMLAGNSERVGGELLVGGEDVLGCDREKLRRLRRELLGFVFQNPVAALDPTMRVARQMELAAEGGEAAGSAAEALEQMGLNDVPRVLRAFPHELSGGMAQRVGIAMTLRRKPSLLVADEPTAAVDATMRPQILALLVERCRADNAALLLMTHDLHAVASHCSRVAVMYAGRIVEDGPTTEVLAEPKHPYTRALLAALPGEEQPGERLSGIPGSPPVNHGPNPGCAFAARCPAVMEHCPTVRPLTRGLDGRSVCCHLYDADAPAPEPAAPSANEAARR